MNKRLLTVLISAVLIFVVACFASCAESAADRLREINLALSRDYSKVDIKVSTKSDDAELNAVYVLAHSGGVTNISYEVDRINTFGADGQIPSEFISTIVGTAVFDGNAVTSIDGEALDENVLLDVADTSMTFRLSYLDDIKVTQSGISAKVINPQGFMQDDEFVCSDMTVQVTLSQSYLARILVKYTCADASVTTEYLFTR